ncbi:hypothetical protein [Actinoplanes sp. NPDC049316]|uniref:hypothetical protein n=1 Tax=Actinoplanes sp. NPDC049316 TaxID=3154727 RepID=UPI0034399C94
MTSQELQNPISADAEILDTEVIVVAQPSPVFVDSTGRRRRVLRRVAYGFGAICMMYGGLVSVSLAGGPVSSSAVLPLPDLADGDDQAVIAVPTPTPEPLTATPSRRPVLEVLPRRNAPVTGHTVEAGTQPRPATSATRPARTPTPKPTTKKPVAPGVPTARPVESGTTKPTTPTTPATTPPATDDETPPPAPPGTGGSGGGTGTPVNPGETDSGSAGGGGGSAGGTDGGSGTGQTGGGGSASGSTGTGGTGGGSGETGSSGGSKSGGSGGSKSGGTDGGSAPEPPAVDTGDSAGPADTTADPVPDTGHTVEADL